MSEQIKSEAVSIGSAEHYMWGNGCEGWHLVRTKGLSVIQERMPPGTSEVRHLHHEARQFFFVLCGTLTIEVDGALCAIDQNCGLEVPPGVPHGVHNGGPQIAEFLVISQPPSHTDRYAA